MKQSLRGLLAKPLVIDLGEFAILLDLRKTVIDLGEKLGVALLHGYAKVFLSQRDRKSLHSTASCGGHIVVIRRDVIHDGIHTAIPKLKIGFIQLVIDVNVSVFDLTGSLFTG